jgi:hypothetical protein
MIGNCDCCDRQNVPVRHFDAGATNAQCETTACFICQGETEIDPYGEMDDRKEVSENGQVLSEEGANENNYEHGYADGIEWAVKHHAPSLERKAFKAGWLVNAAVDNCTPEYLAGCEEVDWLEYQKASALTPQATP